MDITLNIILESIKHYKYELNGDIDAGITFSRLALLPRSMSAPIPGCLYICRLSEAIAVPDEVSGLHALCLRDRLKDGSETPEKLAGLIVINENIALETLFSELQDIFVRINDWYQSMQEALIKQKGIQDIISMSEPVIGNFISVSDSALALIAYTKNIPTDDPTSTYLIQHGYHSEEAVKKFKKFKRFDTWLSSGDFIVNDMGNISKYVIVSKAFSFLDTYFTHVVMTCNHREYSPGLLDLFGILIRVLSYYINRSWETEQNFSHAYNSLLVDLIEEKVSDPDSVHARAGIVGIKPDEQFVVMLLSEGGRGDSVFPARMAQDISGMFSIIRPVYFDTRVILFIQHKDIGALMEQLDMLEKLNSYFRENNIFCGASEIFNDLISLSDAYNQAKLALDEISSPYPRTVVWGEAPSWSNIAHFNSYFISSLLNKSEKTRRIWKSSVYGKKLLALFYSDMEKHTNNLHVLYVYLMNERRAAETATALHMHRNNVVYRINRITEMLDMDLNDRQTRFNLLISFIMLGYAQEYKPNSNPS